MNGKGGAEQMNVDEAISVFQKEIKCEHYDCPVDGCEKCECITSMRENNMAREMAIQALEMQKKLAELRAELLHDIEIGGDGEVKASEVVKWIDELKERETE